jgi:hypothetical protein
MISSACFLSAEIGRHHLELNIATSPFCPPTAPSSLPLLGPLCSFFVAQQLAYKKRRASELEVEFGQVAQKLEAVHTYKMWLEQRIVDFVDQMEYYSVEMTAE